MPIYEYQCGACNRRFEQRQSFSDDPISVCPHCGGKMKVIAFITDYAVIDKIILRIAICEFLYFPDIPPKVSINKATLRSPLI